MEKPNGNGPIEDSHVRAYHELISPLQLKAMYPLTYTARETVVLGRRAIKAILKNGDKRRVIVVGPCSIHDMDVAKDYAERLKGLQERVDDGIVLVMRAYFEKPRTTVGWKGFIYDPYMDGKGDINDGLKNARQLLGHIAELGVPTGTEFLDPFVPQYIGDHISWAAIGARTSESPPHRQMASGLSMPVGFKNNTQGDISVAVNALVSARYDGHKFFGLSEKGVPSIVDAAGNPYVHIILRGSNDEPNYDKENVEKAQAMLRKAGLDDVLMIDCSHGNSDKNYRHQPVAFENAVKQIVDGNTGIIGLMLESNINEGNQRMPKTPAELKHGISVTDACISWETTEKLIMDAYRTLQKKAG